MMCINFNNLVIYIISNIILNLAYINKCFYISNQVRSRPIYIVKLRYY